MKNLNLTFVAEIGQNHNGNIDLCYELIKEAKYAGADIAKFQLGWRAKKGERNQLNKLKWGRNFILPPMIIDYIRDNYSLFLKKPQGVELVVPHLQKNISFTFSIKSKNDPKCFNEAYLCILFRPSNFFIRLFADSLHLSFDKKLRLIKASGPTLLYWKENKHSLVPFSGDSYFNY